MRPVAALIRVEWLALATLAIFAFAITDGSWLLFAVLILAPDLSMLGYLGGPRVGAVCYNALHTTVLPLALLVFGFYAGPPLWIHIALIWLAHIAIDRMLGYGLKFGSGFRDTHMGRIGRD
ncbi:MAG: DUF4260 domain-containing protein [Rhizobiaceae bacterium]|nr:DUF4260 domain-containing protein [Rhizobiaceae bacterium]